MINAKVALLFAVLLSPFIVGCATAAQPTANISSTGDETTLVSSTSSDAIHPGFDPEALCYIRGTVIARSPSRLIVAGDHLTNDSRISEDKNVYVYQRGGGMAPDFLTFAIDGDTRVLSPDGDELNVYSIEPGTAVEVTWTAPFDYGDENASYEEKLTTPNEIRLIEPEPPHAQG